MLIGSGSLSGSGLSRIRLLDVGWDGMGFILIFIYFDPLSRNLILFFLFFFFLFTTILFHACQWQSKNHKLIIP